MNRFPEARVEPGDTKSRIRSAALVALAAGGAGSVALMLRAKQHPPPFLVFLFVLWVLLPFAVLGLAHRFSKQWRPATQVALYVVSFFVAAASLLVYADDALNHRARHPAFVYVAVPPASLLLGVLALSVVALKGREP